MRKVIYSIIAVLMVIAFTTVTNHIQVSLDCFIASVFLFLGIMPVEEGVFNEGED